MTTIAQPSYGGDRIVRGIAAEGMIRAFAITAKDTVETARSNHGTSPLVTAALGRLLMAAQMMGTMFKGPDELLTLMVLGDGPIGGLTVTADTQGNVKGYAANPDVWLPLSDAGKLAVGAGVGAGTLTVVHDIPGVEPYTSQVGLLTGEIGDDIAAYYVMSEQIPTSVGVGVLVDVDLSVKCAGGFIIQLMPGYEEDLLDQLEANLKGVKSVTTMLDEGMEPEEILESLLGTMGYRQLDVCPVQFRCDCSVERAKKSALALGTDQLEDMVAKGEPAEVQCHFCNTRYILSVDQLKELLLQ